MRKPYCSAEELEILSKLLQEYFEECDKKFFNEVIEGDVSSLPLSYEEYYLKNFNKEAEKHLI